MSEVSTLTHETIFSDCRKYRYSLWRKFGQAELGGESKSGFVLFICLNPSTADEKVNDPTIRRCIAYTQDWGYGEMCMCNIFPFRSPFPKEMFAHDEPLEIARTNAEHVEKIAEQAALIIFGWGNHGAHKSRGQKFIKHLVHTRKFPVHHLGLNDDGSPKHPLYLSKTLKPIPYASAS